MRNEDIHFVLKLIRQMIKPLPSPFLDRLFKNRHDPFLILIGCILSLRTKDKVTKEACDRLFAIADNAKSMGHLSSRELEGAIYPVGFFRTKARQINAICQEICQSYQGQVPDEIEELLLLKGVGRKTANLVLTLGYGKLGICVDTHVHRICNRLGYVKTKTPSGTEHALRKKLPSKYWIPFNKWLVTFGQNQCLPTSPRCTTCLINQNCLKIGVNKFR
ncbi:MAG: endonuclease III [Nitrospirales bacterium]